MKRIISKTVRECLNETYNNGFSDDYNPNEYNFNSGDCDIYAISLHRVYGYPLCAIRGKYIESEWDGEIEWDYEYCHIMVKAPNGNYIDSNGEQTKKQILSRAAFLEDVKKVEIVEITEEEALNMFSCENQEDDIEKVMKHIKNTKNPINENQNTSLETFLKEKKFVNPESKSFLYHGTKVSPDSFVLRDDYDGEDSNVWSGDLPEGYLFLTSSLEEARAYGRFIIPCELKDYDNITFKTYADSPSQVFDKDYGIDLFKNDEEYRFWEKFEESGKSVLIIQGKNKMTVITGVSNVIPRTDLAVEFYLR